MLASNPHDVSPAGLAMYLLPVPMRVPLKFGRQVLTEVTCVRVRLTVRTADGRTADGWGETPLNVGWVWPSDLPYQQREAALIDCCRRIARILGTLRDTGHPIEVATRFVDTQLHKIAGDVSASMTESMPHLAGLVCYSAFDLALHDAYGNLHRRLTFNTFARPYMNHDLSHYLQPAEGAVAGFRNQFPADYFVRPPKTLPVWHLVGGLDPLDRDDLEGDEPDDMYPVTLREWIRRDGLKCLKVKLRGNDSQWDWQRLLRVGGIATDEGCDWLTADFNCTVTDPASVNDLLDRLRDRHPRLYGMILYVEQPFPYDLEANRIDVHSCSARKPLFMDESAHDWRLVKLGRRLGWNGVALKTCKTLSGALLTLCWAKAHGMGLMVQDLTNPMLAQVPHVLLAAHAGTIMGVESNAMQFYPDASLPEAAVHPGLYHRRDGKLDLSTLGSTGFGYRLNEIERLLPEPDVVVEG